MPGQPVTWNQPQGIDCSPSRAKEVFSHLVLHCLSLPAEGDAAHSKGAQEWLPSSALRGAWNFSGQRKSYVFQRFVGVPPRGVDVAVSQGALHVGYRHAGA